MTYFEKNPESLVYRDRLFTEWKEYGKIIVGVDFDDTISPWKLHDTDFNKIINILKLAKQVGAYIVIFSACDSDRYNEITEYCASKGLIIDSINKNPIPLQYGNNGKIYANIFIDDRAGLMESLAILENCSYCMKGIKNLNSLDGSM